MMFGGAAGMAGPKRLRSAAQKRRAATPKKDEKITAPSAAARKRRTKPPKNVGGMGQLAGRPRTLGRGTGPKGKVMTPPVKRKAKATRTARGRGSARRGRGGI